MFLLVLQALALWGRGQVYRIVYNKMGVKIAPMEAMYLHIASYTVNVLAPSGGISGVGVFISDALERGIKRSKAILASFVYYLTEYINLALLVLASLIYMYITSQLQTRYVVIFLIFAAILIFICIAFVWLMNKKQIFVKLLSGLIKIINVILRLIRLKTISVESVDKAHDDCLELGAMIKRDKNVLIIPWLIFLGAAICEMILLDVIFVCIGTTIPIEALVVGYSLGLLVITLSITPAGIGLAEPIMTVIFVSLGADLKSSVVAILTFRAITTWLPLVPGIYIIGKMTNDQTTTA